MVEWFRSSCTKIPWATKVTNNNLFCQLKKNVIKCCILTFILLLVEIDGKRFQ